MTGFVDSSVRRNDTPGGGAEPTEEQIRTGVALVIPTFDSAGTLEDLAASIRDQVVAPQEVLVVDSSHSDSTARVARKWGLSVFQAPVSRIEARRIGASQARATWVCLIDSDQILDRDFVREVSAAAQEGTADALTALELSSGEGKWHELLRVQDRVEFTTGEGLPRCWRRELFLKYEWGRLANLTHVHGEDRILRDWLLDSGRTIRTAPRARLYHQDPDLAPFLRKQFDNVRTGSSGSLAPKFALGAARSLLALLSPRAVGRASSGPVQFFGYYWILMSRVALQWAGLMASIFSPQASRQSQ